MPSREKQPFLRAQDLPFKVLKGPEPLSWENLPSVHLPSLLLLNQVNQQIFFGSLPNK